MESKAGGRLELDHFSKGDISTACILVNFYF